MAVGAVFAMSTGYASVGATTEPPYSSPDADIPAARAVDGEVVAQAMVELDDDFHQWNVSALPVDATGIDIVADTYTFLVADGDAPVLVTGADGTRLRLGDGEAAFRFAGTTTTARSAAPTSLTVLTLGTAATASGSDPIAAGAGLHDIDLRRAELAPGETFAADVELPAFVVVTAGSVAANGSTIAAGATASFDGEIALTNDENDPAVVVVAIVSAPLDELGDPGTALPPPADSGPPGPGVVTTTASGSGSAAPSTTAPSVDADSDGLTDEQEAEFGSSPTNPDTDADGVPDGQEVELYGTSPANGDTDGDGVGDGIELTAYYNTNPLRADTDGDGLDDPAEYAGYNTDPRVVDTDGDGAADGTEVAGGTDPLNPSEYPPPDGAPTE